MSWIKKLLGIDRSDNLVKSTLKSGENICPKCGDTNFSYDTYWKESCCQQCGWIIPGNKASKAKQTKTTSSVNRPPKISKKKP